MTYEKQIQDPKQLDRQTSRVILVNSLLLLGFVMFFVFSISLALTPEKLQDALGRNVSAMTVITELQGFKLIPLMARRLSPLRPFCRLPGGSERHYPQMAPPQR